MIALIDADVIMYRSAWKHDGDDTFDDCKETIDAMFEYVFFRTKATHYLGFLTGSDNFRKDVAFTKVYKGNRKDRNKPQWIEACRDYLIEVWLCEISHGMEADDSLGICQTEFNEPTIVCTIDKDLQQVSGCHYNWNTDIISLQLDMDAEYMVWQQVLQGDSTDNIQGIPRIGEVKAKKILDASEFEDYDYSDACLKAYKDYYKEEDLAKKMMQETYDLTTIAISSTDSRLKTNYKLPEPIPIF